MNACLINKDLIYLFDVRHGEALWFKLEVHNYFERLPLKGWNPDLHHSRVFKLDDQNIKMEKRMNPFNFLFVCYMQSLSSIILFNGFKSRYFATFIVLHYQNLHS